MFIIALVMMIIFFASAMIQAIEDDSLLTAFAAGMDLVLISAICRML